MDIAHSVFKNITNFSGIVDYVLVIKCGDKQFRRRENICYHFDMKCRN